MARPEPRKILLVLSDDAPFDEATAAANGRGFLADQLRQVIAELERAPLHLAAIGTSQRVARYYRQALILSRPEEIAAVLLNQLGDLLSASATDRRHP